jgi:hypothetical protein
MKQAAATTMLSCVCLIGSAVILDGGQLLTVRVLPKVATAPANLWITATVEADERNRSLEISAQSDDFVRSSEVQLDGRDAQRVYDFNFPGVPRGNYEVTGTLMGIDGKRAVVTRVVMVVSGLGR